MRPSVKRLTLDAMLLSAALLLSYIEHLLVPYLFLPGVHLGLANVGIMYAFFRIGRLDALCVSLLRVCLMAMLFGSLSSFLFSIFGAVLSYLAILLLSLLGALALGAYLICIAAAGGIEYSGAKLALLCASVLFPLGTTMRYLFVMYRPSNSVENILFAIFAVALLLYILNEGKRMISGVSSRAYTASLLLSLLLLLTSFTTQIDPPRIQALKLKQMVE